MYSSIFAYHIVVAYLNGGLLAFEFEVLGLAAYYGSVVYFVVISHTCAAQDAGVGHTNAIVTYYYILVNKSKCTNLAVGTDFCLGIDVS